MLPKIFTMNLKDMYKLIKQCRTEYRISNVTYKALRNFQLENPLYLKRHINARNINS